MMVHKRNSRKIRIAMIAPPFGQEGGPEVVCKHLTNALAKKGMDITLFAPADWKTDAKHISTLPKSLWQMPDFKKQTDVFRRNLIFTSQLEIIKYQNNFDVIHLHAHRSAYAVAKFLNKPCVLTLHNVIENTEFKQIEDAGIFTVAISSGRTGKNKATAVIENGIDVTKMGYSTDKGKFLLFVGRIREDKGADLAMRIAKKTGKKLVIIGRIGNTPERKMYFKKEIKPYLGKTVIFKDQMPQHELYEYMKNAEALLSLIRTRLTLFPLIVMEALAAGTPVLSSEIQLLPKRLRDSRVLCMSNKFEDWLKAAKEIDRFDRKECRKYAEKNFDSSVMAEKYIRLYKKIMRR